MGTIIYRESFQQSQFILSPAVGNEENSSEIIKNMVEMVEEQDTSECLTSESAPTLLLRMSPQVNNRRHNVIHRCRLLMLIFVIFSALYVCQNSTHYVPMWPECISVLFAISQRDLKQHFNLPTHETLTRTAQKSRFTILTSLV